MTKQRKKLIAILSIVAAIVLILAIVLAVTLTRPNGGTEQGSTEQGGSLQEGGGSQEGGGQTPEHTHAFSPDWTWDDEFHWHAATCGHTEVTSGKTEHTYQNGVCAECGHAHIGHNFDGNQCTVCGFRSDYTTDLVYEEDGDECHVTGMESSHETVVIPATHNGKTVTEILSGAFKGHEKELVHIEIPDTVYWIGGGTFDNCTSLEYETYGELHYLGNFCMECTDKTVTSVSLKPTTTGIYDGAFKDCKELGAISVPDSCITIQNNAFSGCSKLSSVTLGSKLRFVMNSAFQSCFKVETVRFTGTVSDWCRISWYNFSSNPFRQYENRGTVTGVEKFYLGGELAEHIVVPENVTEINPYAFYNCSTIKSISLPGVETIGADAFAGCENLSSVLFGGRLKTIGDYAFTKSAVTSISLPDSLTSLGEQAFMNCRELESLSLGKGLRELPMDAFYRCDKMTSLRFSEGLETIGNDAFGSCTMLTAVSFPASLRTIEGRAFAQSALISLNVPSGVTSIGDEAFSECESMTSAVIGDGVTSIGKEAFYRCSSLLTVKLGKAVATIGERAFECNGLNGTKKEKLQSIQVDATNEHFFSEGGILYDKTDFSILKVPFALSGTVTVANGTKQIPEKAFLNIAMITKVVLPIGLESIGSSAFSGCKALGEVELSEDVQSIGDSAFNGCVALKEIALPAGISSIGTSAFSGCTSLGKLVIPSGNVSVGVSAFLNCSNLVGVTLEGGTPTFGTGAFGKCFRLVEVWNNSTLTITPGQTENGSIAEFAKYVYTAGEESKLKEQDGLLFFEDTETLLIGYLGEEGTLVLPETSPNGSDYQIADYAFYSNANIVSVHIPVCVEKIGKSAFEGCGSLVTVTFAEGSKIKEIGESAFANTYSFESIRIPDGVMILPYGMFFGSSVRHIVFGKNSDLVSIGLNVFDSYSRLESIVLPVNVIVNSACLGKCESLASVYYLGDPETWNKKNMSYYVPESSTVYYFSDEKPSEEQWNSSKNWWHYGEDGSVVLWTE